MKICKETPIDFFFILEQDIVAAANIFEPSVAYLKGKTIYRQVMHARIELTKIHMAILQKYQEIELVDDVMRVNKL